MGGWGGLSLPGGGIGSVPVAGVPASSGAGLPSQDAFMKFLQAFQQMKEQEQKGAGIASGAIAGVPMGGPTPPWGGGVTPGGPVAQKAAQQQQAQGPVPSATGGGSAFAGVVPRQAQAAQQIPYASTGKGAWAANAVYGVSNMLSRQRQEDQQKEYTTAENLWTQVLNAQQNIQNAANQGLDDPEDKARIKAILDDDKNRKMIQDSLPGVLMTTPGDPQQQETDPKKQAQQAGARGALQKLGRTIGGAFDPRTQAQRMPGGTTTPINQPGGAMWKFPEPTQEQKEQAAIKKIISDEEMRQLMKPGAAETVAQRDLKLIPSAAEQIRLDQQKALYDRTKAHYEQIEKHDEAMEKIARDKANAYIKHLNATNAPQNPTAVKAYMDRVQNGDWDIARVPEKGGMRDAVAVGLDGVPIHHKLDATTAWVKGQLDTANGLTDEMSKTLQKMFEANPGLASDEGFTGFLNFGKSEAYWLKYKAHMSPSDPDYRQLIKDAAAIRIIGATPFVGKVGRSRYTLEDIQQHLPAPNDTPAQLADKISWLRSEIYPSLREDIHNMEWSIGTGYTPTGAGATQVPPPPIDEPTDRTNWTPLMDQMGQDDPSPMTPGEPPQ